MESEMEEKPLCASCRKPRNTLYEYRSKLMKNKLLMCDTCIQAGHEPRWIIVVYGRNYGSEAVKRYVEKHLYTGPEIKFSEMI